MMRARVEVLLGALAFATSIPAGKLFLRDLPPLALSGGLYLSAGVICTAALWLGRTRDRARENRLEGREWWWLIAAVGAGGVLAPAALFHGLAKTSGFVAGLLLNFETVFTVGLGALLYRERVGKRGFGGIALVIAGAVALSYGGGPPVGGTSRSGALLVVAACACWGLDNILTARVSLRDARHIVAIKGLAGGAASLGLAALFGQTARWDGSHLFGVFLVGAVAYGLSLMLLIRGLRTLGVMQTGALFALAPGFGAILAWLVLREPLPLLAPPALLAMTAGAVLLAGDVHEHAHTHDAFEHTHEHEHDEHHAHEHTAEELARRPHVHRHRHAPLAHAHPHSHDAHHRHGH